MKNKNPIEWLNKRLDKIRDSRIKEIRQKIKNDFRKLKEEFNKKFKEEKLI